MHSSCESSGAKYLRHGSTHFLNRMVFSVQFILIANDSASHTTVPEDKKRMTCSLGANIAGYQCVMLVSGLLVPSIGSGRAGGPVWDAGLLVPSKTSTIPTLNFLAG